MYLVKMPRWIRFFFPQLIWALPSKKKELFLTFDDGPHPILTPYILKLLKQYNATATFFCIGKNVEQYPHIYQQILAQGHAVGNHTQHHLNGKSSSTNIYVNDVALAEKCIATNLFRPPYGQIKRQQVKSIKKLNYKIIMWSVLSADFDLKITKEKCFTNVVNNAKAGAIIVFHDSDKAANNMQYALPKVLKYYAEQNFVFSKIVI